MKNYHVIFAATIAPVLWAFSSSYLKESDFSRSKDAPATSLLATPPTSLVFELRQHDGGMNFSQELCFEIEARPGDGMGTLSMGMHQEAHPFALVKILDKDHAKVRVSRDLDYGTPQSHKPGGDEVDLAVDGNLAAWTRTICAGTGYTLRISDLNRAPKLCPTTQSSLRR